MTSPAGVPTGQPTAAGARRRVTVLAASTTLAVAAIQAARPRQWPKNLLVFAAPLAGASLG
ncbi:MAG: hypothetical protein ACRDOK_15745, partial [Streptosporangiaceae bacterium]